MRTSTLTLLSVVFFVFGACDDDGDGASKHDAATSTGDASVLDAPTSTDTHFASDPAQPKDMATSDTSTDVSSDTSSDVASVPTTWNATAQFSDTTNPNGVWTYGYSSTVGGTVVVFPMLTKGAGDSPVWMDPNNNALGTPSVWKNTSGSTSYNVPNGFAAMHPGQSGEYAVIRFTAPEAGQYSAKAEFFAGDSGQTDATVFVKGVSVFTAPDTSTNPVHVIAPTALNKNDTIEIWVGAVGSGISDNTPIDFSVEGR